MPRIISLVLHVQVSDDSVEAPAEGVATVKRPGDDHGGGEDCRASSNGTGDRLVEKSLNSSRAAMGSVITITQPFAAIPSDEGTSGNGTATLRRPAQKLSRPTQLVKKSSSKESIGIQTVEAPTKCRHAPSNEPCLVHAIAAKRSLDETRLAAQKMNSKAMVAPGPPGGRQRTRRLYGASST
mmetsp:Transcript_29997/g.65425  ORF Transcript_29997/g.65425 Transcript_29997/m.65425 type:complete len:182 (+) Transcript_29997:301-846(+)